MQEKCFAQFYDSPKNWQSHACHASHVAEQWVIARWCLSAMTASLGALGLGKEPRVCALEAYEHSVVVAGDLVFAP
jgi:hypothetical protein